MGIAQFDGQHAGGDRADPGYFQQALAALVFGQLLRQLPFDGLDLLIQILDVLAQTVKECDQAGRQFGFVLGQQGRQPVDDRRPFGQTDAELQQESLYLVGGGGFIPHQRFAHPMGGRDRLLRVVARTHEAHVRPTRRFADGLGIGKVVLVALHEGFHELR